MAKLISVDLQEIPDYTTVREIKERSNIPPGRDVIEYTGSSVKRLDDTTTTRPGGIYTDVPRYLRGGINPARMRAELALIQELLPDTVTLITDSPHYTYLLLENFPLAPAYHPQHSHILILMPPYYPQTPPGLSTQYGIFVRGGIKRNGQHLQCERDQYHWNCAHSRDDLRKKDWAWWCFAKLHSWDPHRDNLLTILVILAETLQNPERQRFG